MTCLVLSPIRNSALEGPATSSAFGWDLIGRVLALSVTDMEKLLFYPSCFSFARWTVSATRLVFWLALPVLMFLLAGFLIVEKLAEFPNLQNDKGQIQSSPNTGLKSKSSDNPSTSKHKWQRGAARYTMQV